MSLKLKIKINNSYESESGCGSSISENNDYSSIYDDDNLDYIIKPPSYSNEVTITTTTTMAPVTSLHHSTNDSISSTSSLSHTSKDSVLKKDKRELLFGIPVHSSQESSFEGFGNSPFDKLQRIFYPQPPTVFANPTPESSESNPQMAPPKHSPGKNIFTKFYDTILEENSCNAVDIQMSNDPNIIASVRRSSSSSSISNYTDANPSSELSFNGKIKSLTKRGEVEEPLEVTMEPPRLSAVLETSLNASQTQFSESFILKKYSNEKSPDLFGDDDDDDEQVEMDEEEEEPQTQPLNTITEYPTIVVEALNESQQTSACLNETMENNSLNCPADLSFPNDDQTLDCSLTQMSAGGGGNSSDSYTLFRDNCRREREMLRRIRKCLAGVLPPPSVTIPQLDMFTAVLSRKDEILNYFQKSPMKKPDEQKETTANRVPSLFRPTHTLEETKSMPWRDVLGVRQHGLSYNLTKASENSEYLSLSIMERFIGAETATSYRNSPSSAKKRSTRMKLLCQSPGNRLSHLAKRRAIFSSAHLATTSQKSSTLLGPQIMVDKNKKPKNRRKATPKRMTPGSKKKNRKTPSSSARKRLFRNDIIKPGPSRETSKRALFQSPAKLVQQQQRTSLPKPPTMKPELANRVEKSKRALLFTPEKQQEQQTTTTLEQIVSATTENSYFAPSTSKLESLLKRKRNPCDDAEDVDIAAQNSKLMKTGNSGLTPRALKIKSQSFCIGAGSSSSKHLPSDSFSSSNRAMAPSASFTNINGGSISQSMSRATSVSSLNGGGSKLHKSYSETSAASNSLTENQKKKLLWAVSQALQERKITAKHESFKQYASILARVVRRIFQEYYQKGSTSNSETMLRLAKKYVYNVTSGSTADDIYLQAKSQIDDNKRQSTSRLSGYIGPEEYQQLKLQQQSQQSSQSLSQSLLSQTFSHRGSAHNIFTGENSFDSFGLMSQHTSGFCSGGNNTGLSQTSFLGQISQDVLIETSQSSNTRSGKKLVDPNASLHNSSSKSNIYADALRENMDCDVRNSAQKNFTGKDQRNMISYAGTGGSSAVKAHTQLVTEIITNSAKARRQITFDS